MAEFKSRREWRWERRMEKHHQHGQVWTGILLLLIGVAALLNATVPEFPRWVFTWPMLLFVIGLYSGIKSKFTGTAWFILMTVGGIFLAGYINPDLHLSHYAWPIVFIAVGLFFILNSRRNFRFRQGEKKTGNSPGIEDATVIDESTNSKEDYVDVTSIFGGTKKNILSKKFKGGSIVNIFGGTELYLGQADIQDIAVIETTTVFGGTKLIVPPNWTVKSEAAVIFGGIEDKRTLPATIDNPEKILILKGTVIFGGIDIKSY